MFFITNYTKAHTFEKKVKRNSDFDFEMNTSGVFLSWRDDSAAKNIGCSYKIPKFDSQHSHGGSHLSFSPMDLMSSSEFLRHQAHMCYRNTHKDQPTNQTKQNKKLTNLLLHINFKNAFLFF